MFWCDLACRRDFFAPGLKPITEGRGITGLAAGWGGRLDVACPNAVIKIAKDGTFTMLVDPMRLEGCHVDYPDNNTNNALPFVRGMAADPQGRVFAAATACHCALKITSAGKVEPMLKVGRPGSPTGIALHDGVVYLLEHTHATERSPTPGWLPLQPCRLVGAAPLRATHPLPRRKARIPRCSRAHPYR